MRNRSKEDVSRRFRLQADEEALTVRPDQSQQDSWTNSRVVTYRKNCPLPESAGNFPRDFFPFRLATGFRAQ